MPSPSSNDIAVKDVTYAMAYADDMLADTIYEAERCRSSMRSKARTLSKLADGLCEAIKIPTANRVFARLRRAMAHA